MGNNSLVCTASSEHNVFHVALYTPQTPSELIHLPEPQAREAMLRLLYDLIFTKLTFRPKV
jgi:hypothetical protein